MVANVFLLSPDLGSFNILISLVLISAFDTVFHSTHISWLFRYWCHLCSFPCTSLTDKKYIYFFSKWLIPHSSPDLRSPSGLCTQPSALHNIYALSLAKLIFFFFLSLNCQILRSCVLIGRVFLLYFVWTHWFVFYFYVSCTSMSIV